MKCKNTIVIATYKEMHFVKKMLAVIGGISGILLLLAALIVNVIGDSPIFELSWQGWFASCLLSVKLHTHHTKYKKNTHTHTDCQIRSMAVVSVSVCV